jgi:hypothetical protein
MVRGGLAVRVACAIAVGVLALILIGLACLAVLVGGYR